MVAHAYNPSYSGGRSLSKACPGIRARPCLNKLKQKELGCESSGRALVEGSEFKPPVLPEKKKKIIPKTEN
jgi:hypothetical protein